MHVLMVITEADLGGAQRHVLDVSRELQARGYRVTIAVGGTHTTLFSAAAEFNPPISVVRIPSLVREISLFKEPRALFQVYRFVKKLKPDIVHCHSTKAGVIASIAGKLAGARVVYTAHGFVFREEISTVSKYFYRFIEWFASLFRNYIIAVSTSDRDAALAVHIMRAHKIVTIHNGIDPVRAHNFLDRTLARQELSRWTGVNLTYAHIVLCVANLYLPKNVPLLIRAFEYVVRRDKDARLVIVGEGEDRPPCEALIHSIPVLSKTVFLVGSRAQAASIMKAADVFCLSSSKEGLPYTLLEARSAGVPIVATRVGGVSEIGEGPDCQLVVPHSAELLAEKIYAVLARPPQMHKGLPEKFTLSHMVDAIEKIYQKISK